MIKQIIKKYFPKAVAISRALINLFTIYDILLDEKITLRQQAHPNPLTKYGRKSFSQTDEDGITFEIIKRLNLDSGNFAEFGVGDGTENNTLSLLALGWRGFWVGGEDLLFDVSKSKNLHYEKAWVTLDNIWKLYTKGLSALGFTEVDIVSLDLDGNDLYFCEDLLSKGCLPKLFIVEYNAKFPPPMRFTIEYDARHIWRQDDYHGASLTSLDEVFRKFDYKLVCCNAATGANAFFVRREFASEFSDVPDDIEKIYSPPSYFLYRQFAHPMSTKTIERLIE